jgi:hypothetical protein
MYVCLPRHWQEFKRTICNIEILPKSPSRLNKTVYSYIRQYITEAMRMNKPEVNAVTWLYLINRILSKRNQQGHMLISVM